MRAVLQVVALVHAIRISYQITQHVCDVAGGSYVTEPFACDAGGGSGLQPHLLSPDSAAHHTRKDAIPQHHFLPCVNKHTGRRGDKSVSCEDDTASQEAPQQLGRDSE